MEFEALLTAISTVGFPIAAFILMYFMYLKSDEKHSAEVDRLRVTLEENTKVITELYTYLKGRQ